MSCDCDGYTCKRHDEENVVQLLEEIERLQAELDEMKKHLDLALPQAALACQIEEELEQAKSRI